MVRLADGDRDAFAPLFEALWPLLLQFCRRLLGDEPEADDVAQQALLNVFRRADEFDPERDALSWIFGIAAYECKTARRRRLRRKEESPSPQEWAGLTKPQDDPERKLIDRDLLAAAAEILGTLRPGDEEAIRAALGTGPRPAISAAAFRKRLERALRRLRIAWRMKYGSP